MIYTMGHSTLTKEQFLSAIKKVEAPRMVLDVRSHPSSHLEHFWKEHMQLWVPGLEDTRYRWMRELGGWAARHAFLAPWMAKYDVDVLAYGNGKFPKQRIAQSLPELDHPSWTNVGLRDYSYYTAYDDFHAGVKFLRSLGRVYNVIMFCAEAQWWRCHRSMISDVLFYRDVDSVHISPRFRKDGSCALSLKHHADVAGNRILRYDPMLVKCWDEI